MGDDDQVQAGGGDPIRDLVLSLVDQNGGVSIDSLKNRYDASAVPHIKMGQLRKLLAESMGKLKDENASLKQQMASQSAALRQELDEARRLADEERARADKAALDAEAVRENARLKDLISELEAELKRAQTAADNQREIDHNEIARLNGLVDLTKLTESGAQLQRIAELEEQLKALKDALSEAKQEIRRLLSELRYAEPIITPDHQELEGSVGQVREASRAAGVTGEREKALRKALDYVNASEEACRSELPKLIERMNNMEASFPAVARMVKLATLHQEHRRWLSVLGQVLGSN